MREEFEPLLLQLEGIKVLALSRGFRGRRALSSSLSSDGLPMQVGILLSRSVLGWGVGLG